MASRLDSGSSNRKHIRIAHKGPADGCALALTARQGGGFALQQRFDLQDLGGAVDPFLDLRLGQAGVFQAEAEIAGNGHLRIERIGLEHHADAAFRRFFPGHVLAADEDLPVGDIQKPGNAVEQRGLAAAGGPEQNEKFAFADIQVEILQDFQIAEAQGKVLDGDA